MSEEEIAALKDVVMRLWFADRPAGWAETPDGRRALLQHVSQRFTQAAAHVVPWAEHAVGLSGRRVIEIGCGTGSSTAAFGRACAEVHGFEIGEHSLVVARERLNILRVENAELHTTRPENFLRSIADRIAPDDVVLMYAVLEHMTISERLEALEACWSRLGPGGAIIVVETPNRLSYFDRHTSQMPFFHMLPIELALRYYERSPRKQFVDSVGAARDQVESLQRWGFGPSYHEFEIAIGDDVHDHVVATGWEKEITSIYPVRREDEILKSYFEALELNKSIAFARYPLNLIIQKR